MPRIRFTHPHMRLLAAKSPICHFVLNLSVPQMRQGKIPMLKEQFRSGRRWLSNPPMDQSFKSNAYIKYYYYADIQQLKN